MDRFIAICSSKIPTEDEYLKSNMDRFIDIHWLLNYAKIRTFKIQYG